MAGIFFIIMENVFESKKGCVYFFKHIGLSPVKIGYSTHESPIGRFDQFKTYAPYGSELIGFIRTETAKELETILHERFSAKRLNGEWFEITTEECSKVIDFYSNIEDIKAMNEFQIAWARHVENKKSLIQYLDVELIKEIPIKEYKNKNTETLRDFIFDIFRKKMDMPVKNIAKLAGCSKKTVYQYKKEFITP